MKRHPNKPYWLNSETHHRSWLSQRTDASPHTNYLFQFLKSVTGALGFRCLPLHFRARQKRNCKLLRSFRQPPRFLISRCRRRLEPASSQPVLHPVSAAKGAHLTASFLAVNPFEFFIFRGVGDQSNQFLRSPFFNRRPLRRRRILLSRLLPSSPSNFLSFEMLSAVDSVPSQPVFQPAPAAKGAHLTVWLQGVNTPREIFFERVSTAKNMVISSPRENRISWPSREFARASTRLEEFFLIGKVPLRYSQRHSDLLRRDR
jgi:hypothetical protein